METSPSRVSWETSPSGVSWETSPKRLCILRMILYLISGFQRHSKRYVSLMEMDRAGVLPWVLLFFLESWRVLCWVLSLFCGCAKDYGFIAGLF
ncbi:hypothetical protein Pyn_35751 [Prunus yedoensis var. nudiflora]|uniref:Uncharacterized protein n=1 Tax=Prunus yedoensis var. nudiflora TaxID=2094558 RepID=A0A314YHB9_PRUYE|nr:hypothetical protein Pyn_35751 [Prunus yedoensis var. nudiflora]